MPFLGYSGAGEPSLINHPRTRESPNLGGSSAQARAARTRRISEPDQPGRPHTRHPRDSMRHRECAGRLVPSRERATMPTPRPLAAVGPPQGVCSCRCRCPCPPFFWLRAGVSGERVVRRCGSGQPGEQGRSAHPEAPRSTTHNADTSTPARRSGGGADAGCAQGRPGYRSRPRRTTTPRQHHRTPALLTEGTPTRYAPPHPRTHAPTRSNTPRQGSPKPLASPQRPTQETEDPSSHTRFQPHTHRTEHERPGRELPAPTTAPPPHEPNDPTKPR